MQTLGYLLFGFSLLYAFFLWQFPYDQIRRNIIQGFEETFAMKLSIGKLGPSFPSDIAVEKISIDSGAVLFQLPDMNLHPNLLGIFWGKAGFNLNTPGKPRGMHGEFQSQKNQNRVKILLNNLVIKASAAKETSFQMKLSGEATFDWKGEDFDKGTGVGWALLERGEIRGPQNPLLPMPLALFDRIRAEVQLKEGMLRVRRLEVSGKDFNGSFQGDFPFSGKGKGEFPDLSLFLQPPGVKR